MKNKACTKVLLVDSHNSTRINMNFILKKGKNIDVIAETKNGRTAIQLTGELKPDVVVLDYELPDMDGLEVIRQIIAVSANVKVLIVSMHSDSRFVVRMLHAGASGYLLKDSAYEELTKAIYHIISNHSYVSPGIAGIAMEE